MPAIAMSGPGTMKHIQEPTQDPAWVLASEGYDPLRETSVESRFAISNGFLGVTHLYRPDDHSS
jgi:hypothetical protein